MSQDKKVKEYFANNPEEEKVFTTSDGFLFKQEMYATAHAATITDKEVTKHHNTVKTDGTVPAAEVPVTTVTDDGKEIRTKDQTVEVPNVMDSPIEVEGKAEVIVEGITDKVETVKSITPETPAAEAPSTSVRSVTPETPADAPKPADAPNATPAKETKSTSKKAANPKK
ncbi:hypothetical protein CO230_08700 [Chryseobacterium sp. 6424]|nr:hypothetical protein CO230_08700 [Chryseobacterium sp. 6424]